MKISSVNLSEKGFIYCTTGKERFFNEVKTSVKTLRKFNKGVKISLFTDNQKLLKEEINLFDSIHEIKNPQYSVKLFADKIFAIKNSPYQKSVYLDSDTIITDNLSELFLILDEYDIAAVNTPFKNRNYHPLFFNAGMLVFNLNNKTKSFFELWEQNYLKSTHYSDQPAFRNVLQKSHISIFTLPSEYNFRIPFPSYAQKKIKIFHGHNITEINELKRKVIINMLNKHHEERVWFPNKGIIRMKEYKNFITKFLLYLEQLINLKVISESNIKKKLIQYRFPWLINWAMPLEYRERMTMANKKIHQLIKRKSI